MRPGTIGTPGLAESRSWTGRSSSATTGSRSFSGFASVSSTSSIRVTYSSSSFGTHHIFFPPRLQLVAGQHSADRLSAYLGDDPSSDCLLGDQHQRPSRPTRRRRCADHRYDRCLLLGIEQLRLLRPRVLAQRFRKPALQVPPPDPPYFPRVCTHGAPRVRHGPASVQQLKNASSPPHSRGNSLPAQRLQRDPVLGRKLETWKRTARCLS